MKLKLLIPVACLAACAACAGTAPIKGNPQTVTRSTTFTTENLRGYQPLTVRAYSGSRAQNTEIMNAPCNLQGAGYRIAFSTPARVAVPVYGKKTPTPTVTCSYAGQTVSNTARLTNETEGDLFRGMIAGSGLFGPKAALAASIVAAGVVAVRPGKETDTYGFKSLSIVFANTSKKE